MIIIVLFILERIKFTLMSNIREILEESQVSNQKIKTTKKSCKHDYKGGDGCQVQSLFGLDKCFEILKFCACKAYWKTLPTIVLWESRQGGDLWMEASFPISHIEKRMEERKSLVW